MAPKASSEQDDWIKQLDAELERQTQDIMKDAAELQTQMGAVNKTLIFDFDQIKDRFDKQRIFLTMEPQRSVYAQQDDTLERWEFKADFKPQDVRNIQLIDRTQEQGRMGDSLKAWYYNDEGTVHLRMIFEYCEGEHYYKYGPTPTQGSTHWYTLGAANNVSLAGHVATFTITDGAIGDDDLAVNGTIVDAGGPATVNAGTGGGGNGVATTPTLGQWGMMILTLLLGLGGARRAVRARSLG